MGDNPTIGVVVDDMFFAAKILATARAAGSAVWRIKSPRDLEGRLPGDPPSLLIVDLNAATFDVAALIESIRARPELASVPAIGFMSHVQTDLKRRAEEAGYDYVIPRSLFTAKLAEIVRGNLASLPRPS